MDSRLVGTGRPAGGRHREGLAGAALMLLAAIPVCLLLEFALVIEARQSAREAAAHMAGQLERNLTQNLAVTQTLAAFVKEGGGRFVNFAPVANDLLVSHPGVSALQLAPGGVIRDIVPLAGHERALGHDLLADPQRDKEARKALETRALTLAGPFTLRQGGEAMIGRRPVFIDGPGGKERFWGFTIALIRLPDFVRTVRLSRLEELGYAYELGRLHPDSGQPHVFARSPQALGPSAERVAIEVPNGRWHLDIAPLHGWHPPLRVALEVIAVALLTLLAGAIGQRLAHNRRTIEESEERWKFALEGAGDGVWDWNLQTGELYLSRQEMSVLGYEGDGPSHGHIDDWVRRQHPDDRPARQAALERYLSGETPIYTCEFRTQSRDGRWRWLQARGLVVARSADGKPLRMIGTHTDIGERKAREEARRRELASLEALNQIGAIHYARLEDELRAVLAIGTRHFGLEFGIVSRIEGESYEVVSQVSPPQTLKDGQRFVLGATYCALALEAGGIVAIAHMGDSPHRGHPCYQTFRLEAYIGAQLRVAGTVFGTINFSSASPYGRDFDQRDEEFLLLLARWVGAAIDRHEALRRLAESEAKLRGLYELSPLGIVLTDMNGRFLEFNEAFRRITGYATKELHALDYWALTPARYEAEEQRQLESLRRTGHYGPYEKEYLRKDGSLVPIQLNGLLVTKGDGEQLIWSIVEDITPRKQAEKSLREQKEFLAAILENEPECVKVVDTDGSVLQINNAGLAMLEAESLDAINERRLISFVAPEYRPAFRELQEKVFAGETGGLEFQMTGQRGSRRWLETRAAPLRDAAGKVSLLLGVTRDITRRREAEDRLALSLRGADLAMSDWSIPDDRLVFGDGWTKLLGYPSDELPPHIATLASLVRPEDAAAARTALISHLKGETPYLETEIRMRHRHGHWVWVLARGMAVERDADGRAVRVAGTAMDISARKQAEAEILRLSQWNELLLNSAGEGIYGVDQQGRCTFINPAALAMLGFERHEVLGKNPHELFHHHHADGTAYPIEDCPLYISLHDGVRREAEDVFLRKDGQAFPVMMTATPMHEDGVIVGGEVVFQDIAQRKAMEQELVRLATTDALTGVANRRRFLEQLEMELARLRRFGIPAAFLMVDLDHFKAINDSYGHAVGDTVLQHFTELCRQRLRRTDLIGRLGGEEFGILLPGSDGPGARQFAEGFRRHVAESPAATASGAIHLTISIGLAEFEATDHAPDSLLGRADVALYRAKGGGRNRVEML